MLRLKQNIMIELSIPYSNDVDKNHVTILCLCCPILILYLHAEPPERVKNYKQTRQNVNNLSKKNMHNKNITGVGFHSFKFQQI